MKSLWNPKTCSNLFILTIQNSQLAVKRLLSSELCTVLVGCCEKDFFIPTNRLADDCCWSHCFDRGVASLGLILRMIEGWFEFCFEQKSRSPWWKKTTNLFRSVVFYLESIPWIRVFSSIHAKRIWHGSVTWITSVNPLKRVTMNEMRSEKFIPTPMYQSPESGCDWFWVSIDWLMNNFPSKLGWKFADWWEWISCLEIVQEQGNIDSTISLYYLIWLGNSMVL